MFSAIETLLILNRCVVEKIRRDIQFPVPRGIFVFGTLLRPTLKYLYDCIMQPEDTVSNIRYPGPSEWPIFTLL